MRKTFIKKGVRELWKHKFQYLFLALILGLGVATYSSFYNMADARLETLTAIYDESRFMDLEISFQQNVFRNQSDIEDLLEGSSVGDDIESVEYRLSFNMYINHTENGEVKTTKGRVIGISSFDEEGRSRSPSVNRPLFFSDDPRDFSSDDARECIIEHKFAKAGGIEKGDTISIMKGSDPVALTVLEDASVPEYFFVIPEGSFFPSEASFGVLILPIGTSREVLFGEDGNSSVINDVVIGLKDGVDVNAFKAEVETLFNEAMIPVLVIRDEDNPSYNLLWEDYENDKENMNIFPMVIFMVSGFGLIIALRRMIQTHRPQIGIFKALGIPDRTVLWYFTFIGLMVGVLGMAVGWILTFPLDMAFNSMLDSLYDFAIMRTAFSWSYLLISGAISIVLCLACTMIPAWRALRIKPIDAINSREGQKVKRTGKFANRVVSMHRLSVPLKLTARNFLRRPQRSLSTVIGVALAIGLFFSFAVVLESMVILLDDTSAGNEWDYEVAMDLPVPIVIGERWQEEYPQISHVNPGLLLYPQIVDKDETKATIVYAVRDVDVAFDLDLEKGSHMGGQLMISKMFASEYDLDVGDHLDLLFPYRHSMMDYSYEPRSLEVSGIQTNLLDRPVIMDLATAQVMGNFINLTNLLFLNTDGGQESVELENGLITTEGVRSVTHIEQRQNLLEQYFDLFMQVMIVMGLVSMLMAGAIVYNMFKINARENRRDYATMKTLGTSMVRLSKLIFLEGAIVTVLAVAVGTFGGYWLAVYMMQVSTDLGFEIPILFSWSGFLASVIMIVTVVVIVSLFTIRYISKINIANVIRERSSG